MVRGQQAVFTARDDYWGEKPFMKTVIMREVPTSAARLSLLQGGAVDIAQFLQPREYISIKDDPNITFDLVNSSYMIWLELNSKIPPFDNVKVRQAMNYAMPRDEIIRTVLLRPSRSADGADALHLPGRDVRLFPLRLRSRQGQGAAGGGGSQGRLQHDHQLQRRRPYPGADFAALSIVAGEIGVNITLEKLPAGVFYENVTKRAKPMIFSPGLAVDGGSWLFDLPLFPHQVIRDYSNYENSQGQPDDRKWS